MIAHKWPGLTVLEVDLNPGSPPSSFWLERADTAARAACKGYQFTSDDAARTVAVQNAYSAAVGTEFTVSSFSTAESQLSRQFDLAIFKLPAQSEPWFRQALVNLPNVLTETGFGLVIHADERSRREVHCAARELGALRAWSTPALTLVQMARSLADEFQRTIYHVKLQEGRNNDLGGPIDKALSQEGEWKIICVCEPEQVPPRSKVLVLDELKWPIMSRLDGQHWAILQHLMQNQCDLLWVTSGAQMDVINPTQAAIFGFLRVLRNEEPLLRLVSLDVESPTATEHTVNAIGRCLRLLAVADAPRTHIDSEYVERGGIIHVSRVLPDTAINDAQKEEATGRPEEMMSLHNAPSCIRLRAERIGDIEALRYSEVSAAPLPLEANEVEVEVYAAGTNFKDLAVIIGIVPDNEYLLGGEGAGIITRVARDVTNLKPGQRVVFFKTGALLTVSLPPRSVYIPFPTT